MALVPNPLPPIVGTPEKLLPRSFVYVQIKKNWSDDWTFAPWLTAISSTSPVAPEVGRAEFEYEFGSIKREQSTSFSTYPPLKLRDYYVRILFQNGGFAPQVAWTGIFQDEETTSEGITAIGVQRLVAYELSHLLDMKDIDSSWVFQAASSDDEEDEIIQIERIVTFNEKNRKGRRTDGNRSDNPASGGGDLPEDIYYFDNKSNKWTNAQIVRYLCWFFGPDAMDVQLAGQYDALEKLTDVLNPKGKTLWQCLNELIDRRRGIGFYPIVSASGLFYIYVFTLVEVDVPIDGTFLPKNPNQQYFELPSTYPYSHIVGEIPFHVSSSNTYDTIKVRGDRVRVAATFSFEDSVTLNYNWTPAIEVEYKAASDKARSADKFKSVYSQLRVPMDWDGKVGDGAGESTKTSVYLKSKKNGVLVNDASDAVPMWRHEREFERSTFFEVGVDYTDSDFLSANPTNSEPEYVPLIAFIYDNREHTVNHVITNQYYLMDKLDSIEGCHGVHVRPLDNQLGVEWTHTPRHYFASASDWEDSGIAPAATETSPEFDWRQVGVTGVFALDIHPTITLENMDGDGLDSGRTLIIDVPTIQTWYVAPNTVVDIQGGQLIAFTDETRYVRNDRQRLLSVASFALAWYGVRRQAVQIPINNVGLFVQLGTYLTDIHNAWMKEPVRTVVTARHIDYRLQSTMIETGWTAFDVELAKGFSAPPKKDKPAKGHGKAKVRPMSHAEASEAYGHKPKKRIEDMPGYRKPPSTNEYDDHGYPNKDRKKSIEEMPGYPRGKYRPPLEEMPGYREDKPAKNIEDMPGYRKDKPPKNIEDMPGYPKGDNPPNGKS